MPRSHGRLPIQHCLTVYICINCYSLTLNKVFKLIADQSLHTPTRLYNKLWYCLFNVPSHTSKSFYSSLMKPIGLRFSGIDNDRSLLSFESLTISPSYMISSSVLKEYDRYGIPQAIVDMCMYEKTRSYLLAFSNIFAKCSGRALEDVFLDENQR
ncbi:hypothetical protein Tco_1363420 [Tanacetum coccineum]